MAGSISVSDAKGSRWRLAIRAVASRPGIRKVEPSHANRTMPVGGAAPVWLVARMPAESASNTARSAGAGVNGLAGAGAGVAGAGSGVGFGVRATPAGVYVVRGDTLKWEPAVDMGRVILVGQLVAIVALLVLRSILKR